jgi:hypothetical protein
MTTEIQQLDQIARHDKIISLAQSALANANDTKARARLSIDEATECGRLLIEEKLNLKKSGKKLKWAEYFDTVYSKHLGYSTATNWMRLASKGENTPLENTTRAGMLALEIFPHKIHEENDNVKNAKQANFTSPASLVNKFIAWRRKFSQRVTTGSLNDDQIAALKIQFGPIIDFVNQLQAGSLPEAAKKSAE